MRSGASREELVCGAVTQRLPLCRGNQLIFALYRLGMKRDFKAAQ